MKKLVSIFILSASMASAYAHGPHGYWRQHNGGGGWHWVAPAIIGGVIGYEIARPPIYTQPPVVVQQPPVVIQQQPQVVIQGQNCSPWTQIQNQDGTITSTRTCTQ